ncbi:conserved protein of unknown function [Candidatus Hydrogenisulfobacillus filiaventi]|uniref:Glycosyltransferase family 4 protein n=1 Tax=Candidatus Hydrogenisulfobacillus filiaventi TaxID=2707344 RepID=A0A6F8ZDK7_9FIRM|nr:glycosyltransferase [Bacillota bacterium]CAB1127835.1 conserved protein of unknown function [Candidatus Hydrogenisulfobacillus filiaventi]
MRVALVHDWLVTMGGAERVLEEFARLFPEAPIYTGVVIPERLSPLLRSHPIIPSFVQHWPGARRRYNRYLPFLAYAFEQFDLSGYDLVLSSSASVAKGVLTRAETAHVSYIHTPMRYAWDLYPRYRDQEAKGLTRRLMGPVFHWLRLWDRMSADRPDVLIANSRTVEARIAKHWHRRSYLIWPPVDVDRIGLSREPGEYYLVLSRLVGYKRVDLAVAAATRARLPLIVAGDGPDLPRLRRMAGPGVRFLGRVDEATRVALLQGAKALLFPGEEDFGITPVEAMAAGRPVIAYGRGGVLDSVEPGVSGVFFREQTVEDLLTAVEAAEALEWDRDRIRAQAERFRPQRFREELTRVIEGALVAKGLRPG